MIRVLLVDDHAVVRTGFRMLLESAPDIAVAGEADDGEAAYRRYAELRPDVVVMDLSMPGVGGIAAVRRIVAHDAQARVLALSAHEDAAYARHAFAAGALGYLSKRGAPGALIEAVREVAAGRRTIEPAIAQKLALAGLPGGGASPVDALTEREFEVFVRLARGQSVARIAQDLKLSAGTVGTHQYNVKQKLGASNQAELTLIAVRHGLIEV